MAKQQKKLDWSALWQTLDNSFARSSTKSYKNYSDPEDREPIEWRIDSRSVADGPSDFAVKARLMNNDHIQLMYITTFVYQNNNQQIAAKKKWDEESEGMILAAIKKVKKEYKESTGNSISFKEEKTDITLQEFNVSLYGARNSVYYRRFTTFKIS